LRRARINDLFAAAVVAAISIRIVRREIAWCPFLAYYNVANQLQHYKNREHHTDDTANRGDVLNEERGPPPRVLKGVGIRWHPKSI
jgi:hypothetical protein